MATLLTRDAAVLFKIEGSEGVDAAPDATSGVLVTPPRITFNPTITQDESVTSSLDDFDTIVGGMSAAIEFDIILRGSGTVGTAPDWAPLLKVCGFAETVTASAVPAAPEALAAGGSTTTATLGATASSTAQAYRGMPVLITGAQSGTSFIWDYSAGKLAKLTDTFAAALVATSNYQIPINVRYGPASASISSGTCWIYNGATGILYKFAGCRGTGSLSCPSGAPWRISMRLMGMFTSKTDSTIPAIAYSSVQPPVWRNGAMTINSVAAALSSLTMDIGGQLTLPDNPNVLEGHDPAIITRRQMRGTMDPKETLVATRDLMAAFRAQTKQPIHARLGSTAGNRFGLTIPSALYLNQTPTDRSGYMTVNIPFHATGQDSGFYLTQY